MKELLAAGINVYTTLNIQHLESLNDIVAQITGVRVQETVPDRLLEEADQVQLIDIPPEELIDRLREGKVYVPHQAERAMQKFFRPGNINALRELALRHTAQRVEGQLDRYMRVHGSGMMQLKREWCDMEDIIGVVLGQLQEPLQGHPLQVAIPPDLPLIRADFTLLEQVLINLLENALKYSPPGSPIDITVRQEEKTEYEILKHLAVNAGRVLTHRQLLRTIWGPEYQDETHYLRVYIGQLRRKLEPDPTRPRYIITEPGVGYRLVGGE